MDKLSPKEYWDSIYHPKQRRHSLGGRMKAAVKRVIGKEFADYFSSYQDYLLWEVFYKKYLPAKSGAKVMEIGSAPGRHLLRLWEVFGYEPYGVEYSEGGVELNRQLFISHDIDPDNVIHADFFSEEFHERYKNHFDIVVSRGFIEHFTKVEEVIRRHVNLLKEGGYLVVSIPNFRGINRFLASALDRENVSIHNLDIMGKERFSELFRDPSLTTLFCGYYGAFSVGHLWSDRESLRAYAIKFCRKFQIPLNFFFRLVFRGGGPEHRSISPNLLYIGVKKHEL